MNQKKVKISIITSLYNCFKYLDRYFENLLKLQNLSELEFIFIHNAPRSNEKEKIFHFVNKHKIIYQYVSVERENLYKSWNRGIKLSKGKYIAVWNVDDYRYADSLTNQADVLNKYPDVALVYGDKHVTRDMDYNNLKLIQAKDIYKNKYLKKFQDGVFLMWRKEVHDKIGYFDEQLKSAGDQDFWYRVLYFGGNGKKCNGIVGIYSDIPFEGISKGYKNGSVERALIAKRYGFWSPVNLNLYFRLKKEYYQYIRWYDGNYPVSLSKKPFNKVVIKNIINSLIYTTAYYLMGNLFYKFREYL